MSGERFRARVARMTEGARRAALRADANPALLKAVKLARQFVPGDGEFGDALSTAGSETPSAIARRFQAVSSKQPSVLGQVGMGALQMWQAASEAQGRGRGDRELAVMFTDLVEFSSWALDAGDDDAVELLRLVSEIVEPAIQDGGGRVVKRLGDGLMAVFPDTQSAVDAAYAAIGGLDGVEIAGYRPHLRAGVHLGRPRKIGGDYLGVDVNIAARVAQAAAGGEVLVSSTARANLVDDSVQVKRRWRFRAKGAPKDLDVFAVTRRRD